MLPEDSKACEDQGRCQSVPGRAWVILLSKKAQEGRVSVWGAVGPIVPGEDGLMRGSLPGSPIKAALEMPEPCEGKLSHTVLRGEEGRKPLALPGRRNSRIDMTGFNKSDTIIQDEERIVGYGASLRFYGSGVEMSEGHTS
jgi:hypothetical protein